MIKKIFRRITLLFKSIVLSFFFLFRGCFCRATLKNGNVNFVVSLTTYGWRYNFVFLTIESIFFQEVKPSVIFLWIHKDEHICPISKWFLQRQIKRGLIVRYVDIDTRSYKKLSYILSDTNCAFDFIVTADDDVFYPKSWLRNFVENPKVNTHILCNRGRVITFESNTGLLKSYKYWPLANTSHNSRNCILPTGVSGICYPIKALDMRISDFDNIHKLCPYADDIWYKMITTANGYKSVILEHSIDHFPPLVTSLNKGLEKMNVNEDLNTRQFTNSLSYFGLGKDSFEREFQ
ncbi:hypothetical protein [Enterobacter ludwigii]|jgi:hypothetical protein|uniref:hypothetical protein n=1 Tax=Enterobacter ludwigii TaxID=299767 RepID=UPI00110A5D82|nr:hypothetical protein [Enterobacter ludwigii]MDP9943189.1 hypothetical protein [Enterobacter ludwigii]QCV80699.1 hypothetical protein ELLBI42_14675 [Enterobacter ludwigii]QDE50874.1 hypothetical protein ECI140_14675 [Enterobacter ludwigii]